MEEYHPLKMKNTAQNKIGNRQGLVALYQLAIAVGILCSYFCNAFC